MIFIIKDRKTGLYFRYANSESLFSNADNFESSIDRVIWTAEPLLAMKYEGETEALVSIITHLSETDSRYVAVEFWASYVLGDIRGLTR